MNDDLSLKYFFKKTQELLDYIVIKKPNTYLPRDRVDLYQDAWRPAKEVMRHLEIGAAEMPGYLVPTIYGFADGDFQPGSPSAPAGERVEFGGLRLTGVRRAWNNFKGNREQRSLRSLLKCIILVLETIPSAKIPLHFAEAVEAGVDEAARETEQTGTGNEFPAWE